jgi:hypothetical protein
LLKKTGSWRRPAKESKGYPESGLPIKRKKMDIWIKKE